MNTIIYTLANNEIPFYIGKTVNVKKRIWQHKVKYPNATLEEIDNVPTSQWRFWEQYYMSLFYSWGFSLKNKRGYDGVGPDAVTEETRRKLSIKLKGRVSPRKGVKLSDETKGKIKKAAQNNKNEWRKGMKLSDETKLKMSLAKLGKSKPHMKLPRNRKSIYLK